MEYYIFIKFIALLSIISDKKREIVNARWKAFECDSLF